DSFTKGGAYSLGREQELGTIESGKLADIVVLDKNLFSINTAQILDTSPLMTIMNGRIVYHVNQKEVE
ncbi:amidohydrolase family protein, partial [Intestinibacillus massiliensis]|nr:amidohydrolase family protein [Intestinibacillus massiliensis]